MADTQDNTIGQDLDYYKVRVFLYKYTPVFIRTPQEDTQLGGGTTDAGVSNQSIETWRIDLDEKAYFTKYDLSEYLSSYSFNQSISENTYDWSVILHDPILTFDQINNVLKVEGSIKWDAGLVNQLAAFEVLDGQNFAADSAFIANAKRQRGSQSKSFDTKTDPASALLTNLDNTKITPSGLRLSDFIQPYDMISIFLYKGKTPIEDLTGAVIIDTASGLPVFVPVAYGGLPLTKKHLQTESILLSRISEVDNNIITLFSPEAVGYVMEKSFSTTTGEVDTVTLTGNGMTRLFGSTRRIIKSSNFQRTIFKINEISGAQDQISVFNNTFNGLKLHQIFQQLFNDCYRINFDAQNTQVTSLVGLSELVSDTVPNSSFFDISSLKVNNANSTNMFSIPPFLLALVLKRWGYRYRDVTDNSNITTLLDRSTTVRPTIMVSSATFDNDEVVATGDIIKEEPTPVQLQSSIDTALDLNANLQVKQGYSSPVFFNPELDDLRPYFKFFEAVLENYNPRLSTPYEIIDELKEKTFLEFIDRPFGCAIIRAPQYNDTDSVIYSDTLDILGVSYNQTVSPLVARQTVKYAVDALPNIPTMDFLAFTDGKLLLQFGQLEAAAEANPNYRGEKIGIDSQSEEENRRSGIINYARYLLSLHNASLATGTITCGYDSRIEVGKTYFDKNYSKFGYITSVTKTIATGGAATMSFNLSYVRDAVISGGELQVKQLPTILDIAQGFTTATIERSADTTDQRPGLGTDPITSA